MKNLTLILAAMVLGFFLLAAYVLIFTLPAMWIWNWIIPTKFSGPHLSFTEMFGLLVLSKIIFGNVSSSTRKKSE